MPRPSRNVDQALLASGAVLYPQLGCAGLSVRAVAAHAGVTPGMFHYHFESKEAIWLAVIDFAHQVLLARLQTAAQSHVQPLTALRAVFMGGFWTNVLNPKVVIFFLAFVPQFIAPGTENKTLAFLLLGLLFTLNALPVCAGWAIAAAWMGRRVDALQRGMHWLDRVAGLMFIGFGLKLAVTDSPAA